MKKFMLMPHTISPFCNIGAAKETQGNASSVKAAAQSVSSDPFFEAKGMYEIGTTYFTWNCNDDKEVSKYVGQIWYPAEYSAVAKKASYLPKAILKTDLVEQIPLLASVKSVITGAMMDAPLYGKNNRYPVLLYSPGLGLLGQVGTFFFEYFASRGFIVAAIDHPGSSYLTEKEDGSLVLYNVNFDDQKNPNYETEKSLTGKRAAHLSSALNALLNLNTTPSSMFLDKMDTNRMGVFGHSDGGRSALRAASQDNRFKAAANLDGSIEDEPSYTFTNQEILMAQTDLDEQIQDAIAAGQATASDIPELKEEYAQTINNLLDSHHAKKYLVYFNNTRHMNYTDLAILLENPDQVGSADAHIVLKSVSKLLDDFFNEAFFPPEFSLENTFSYPYAKLIKVNNNLHD